jgi:hypothetical protein
MSVSPYAPTRKPRRWRWLLVIAAAALLVGVLPALLLAQWGPYFLGRALSASLQTSVTVQRVTGGWWNGVTVHQLTVAEDLTPQASTLVRITSLTINLPVVTLVFSSKPLIVRVTDVHIDVRKRQDGQWNLTPLLKALETRTSARSHVGTVVPRPNRQIAVTVTHGTLRLGQEAAFTDLAMELHWTAGRLTITQAEARVAGGLMALQGEVAFQEPTPSQVLHWRLVGIRVEQVLGAAWQPVTIAEATGRLSKQGDGLVLETAVQIPVFALAPGTLGRRQPRLTHVALTCTLTLPRSLTRLAMEACRLHATEAQLALRDSAVDLGPKPQLTLQVDGSLAGSLLSALAPEVPGHFPDTVRVAGQLTVPLRGAVWHEMSWRLAVTSDRFVFDDTLTEVHTTVVKSVDQIDIVDLHARRGTGRIYGAGTWRLAEPVSGDLHVQMEHVVLQQSLLHGTVEGPYVVEGIVSGTMDCHMDADGTHFTINGRVHPLHLRHAATTGVQGRLGRHRDGTWWGQQLAFLSDDLTVIVHQGQVRLSPAEAPRFEVRTTLGVEGAWLTPWLATAGIGELVLSGHSEVTVQAAGHPDHPFETMEGQGTVHADGGSFHAQAFSSVEVRYELSPGRLHITEGVVRFDTGVLTVSGSLGFPQPFSESEAQLSARLRHVPVRFAQQPPGLHASGPATLSRTVVLNGEVTAQGTESGQIRLGLDLQMPKTTRQGGQSGQGLIDAELPALRVVSEVLTAPPWAHWHTDTLRIQGDGLTAALRDVVVRRTPTHYDLSGALDLRASAEVITGLTGDLLPDRLQIAGPVELAGNAAGHIAVDGSASLRDITYTGDLRVARMAWNSTWGEAVVARLTVAQGQLTLDDARARVLGGWIWFRPDTFVDLQGPRHAFHLHLAAEQLDLRLETGKRMPLVALVIPLFLLEPDRGEPIRVSGLLDAEVHASGTYDGQPGWSQSVNGEGSFRLAQAAVLGSTVVSGFVTKALTLPSNLVDQSLRALLDRGGKPLQLLESWLRQSVVFGTLASPIQLRTGEIHLTENLIVSAPEFSMLINGHSTLEGEVDYDVHSDLIHRLLFGEVLSLPHEIPWLGAVLRHINPFQLSISISSSAPRYRAISSIAIPPGSPMCTSMSTSSSDSAKACILSEHLRQTKVFKVCNLAVAMVHLSPKNWCGRAKKFTIGCSICKSSPPEAFDEWLYSLPLNRVECG